MTTPDLTQQYAALPWRQTGTGIEVLLISSRQTKRWVIPKGWPIQGLAPRQSATREAYEEAGVGGQTGRKPIGHYEYSKRMKDGTIVICRVAVFSLEVMIQHTAWPEQDERMARWFSQHDAAAAVAEPQLSEIIRSLR